MNVAVLYQSLRGGTERAAHTIGEAFQAQGAHVGIYPVDNFDAQFVLKADLLVLGSWTDGLFGIAARPGQLGKLNALPSITGRKTSLFLTYEISPEKALGGFTSWAEDRGADVVTTGGFKVRGPFRGDIGDDVATFVSDSLAALEPANA